MLAGSYMRAAFQCLPKGANSPNLARLMSRISSLRRMSARLGLTAGAGLYLLSASVAGATESSLAANPAQVELDKAKAAKKQAGEEKARTYLDAHLLYKNCAKELRPFCMMSAQMMMRNADARYKNREKQEFANIVALEAAISAGAAIGGPDRKVSQ
jgi:hypothetical protein